MDQLNVSESQPQSSKPTKLQKSPTNNINSDSTENSKSSGSPQGNWFGTGGFCCFFRTVDALQVGELYFKNTRGTMGSEIS